jgi:hypothetical protein
MGRRQQSRWGRGSSEGWSLEIGMAFHGSVVRRDRSGPPTWITSINSTALGEFLEREIAMRRVDEFVESSMELALHDWELYRAAKGKR